LKVTPQDPPEAAIPGPGAKAKAKPKAVKSKV
jgi:hypothetical protein